MYPRIKIIKGLESVDELFDIDTLVFDSILDLDKTNSNNIDEITKMYKKFYDLDINLMFDRSPNCDSSVVNDYLSKISDDEIQKRVIFVRLLEMQIESYINIKDASANLKKNSQKIASRIEGKSYGRPKGTKRPTDKSRNAKEIITKYSKDFNGVLSDEECIKKCGASRNMFYVYKRELKKEQKDGSTVC